MFVDLRKRRRAFSILHAAHTGFEDRGNSYQPTAGGEQRFATRTLQLGGAGQAVCTAAGRGCTAKGGWRSRFALLQLDLNAHDMPLAVQLISGSLLHQRAAGAHERRHGPGRRHHEGGGRGQAKGEEQRKTHAGRLSVEIQGGAKPLKIRRSNRQSPPLCLGVRDPGIAELRSIRVV